MRLSGPLTPQPVGDRSPKIVAGHSRPPPPPRPQGLLRRQGETGSATPRVPVVFLGARCWEGVPEGWRRHAARVEEWPGRFLHFSSPPSLTLILLPPRNLRSGGAESGFRGAHSEMGQLGARCCAGVPLNWAQNQALCPRFKPVVRSVRRWAAAEAREFKQLGQLRSFQRGRAARRGPA